MRTDGLSLEHLPPLMTPYRFFISAPLAGVLAAALLLAGGTDIWSSRWTPGILAATHLLTLGFMATVMMGAMFQVLPVLSGHSMPAQKWLAPATHGLLSSGTVALAMGFLTSAHGWHLAALLLLLAAFGLFIGGLGLRLLRPIGGGDAIFTIRLAALSLLLTVVLGLWMLWGYSGGQLPTGLEHPGTSHLRFGLLGWVLLLIMGVSYQVIPMFHVTPNYPKTLTRLLPAGIFVALLLLSMLRDDWPGRFSALLLLVASTYALLSLNLLRRRQRKIVDYTVRFWQLGLGNLLLALLGWGAALAMPQLITPASELLWGIVVIVGFAISIMMGMLHKIAPFLSWLHLQRACLDRPLAMLKLPTMHELLPAQRARRQLQLHSATLVLMLAASMYAPLGSIAALALAMDFGWLGLSLLGVLRAYRRAILGIGSNASALDETV